MMNKPTTKKRKTKKSGTTKASEKPHFFSDEAKAERFKKRMGIVASCISSIQGNNQIVGKDNTAFIDTKGLEATEVMLKRLSLKELELLKALFINAELAAYTMGGEAIDDDVAASA